MILTDWVLPDPTSVYYTKCKFWNKRLGAITSKKQKHFGLNNVLKKALKYPSKTMQQINKYFYAIVHFDSTFVFPKNLVQARKYK